MKKEDKNIKKTKEDEDKIVFVLDDKTAGEDYNPYKEDIEED